MALTSLFGLEHPLVSAIFDPASLFTEAKTGHAEDSKIYKIIGITYRKEFDDLLKQRNLPKMRDLILRELAQVQNEFKSTEDYNQVIETIKKQKTAWHLYNYLWNSVMAYDGNKVLKESTSDAVLVEKPSDDDWTDPEEIKWHKEHDSFDESIKLTEGYSEDLENLWTEYGHDGESDDEIFDFVKAAKQKYSDEEIKDYLSNSFGNATEDDLSYWISLGDFDDFEEKEKKLMKLSTLQEGRKADITKILGQLYAYIKRTNDPDKAEERFKARLEAANCSDDCAVVDDVADFIENGESKNKGKALRKIYKKYFPKPTKENPEPTEEEFEQSAEKEEKQPEDPREEIPGSAHYNTYDINEKPDDDDNKKLREAFKSQAEADKFQQFLNDIREALQDTVITPDEAIDALMSELHYGHEKAVQLVDKWGKGKFSPYSVWSNVGADKNESFSESAGDKAAHPTAMKVAKGICNKLGYSPKFIDGGASGYRIKLGSLTTDENTGEMRAVDNREVEELQLQLNKLGYPEIKAKLVGSPYSGFGKSLGFIVPYDITNKLTEGSTSPSNIVPYSHAATTISNAYEQMQGDRDRFLDFLDNYFTDYIIEGEGSTIGAKFSFLKKILNDPKLSNIPQDIKDIFLKEPLQEALNDWEAEGSDDDWGDEGSDWEEIENEDDIDFDDMFEEEYDGNKEIDSPENYDYGDEPFDSDFFEEDEVETGFEEYPKTEEDLERFEDFEDFDEFLESKIQEGSYLSGPSDQGGTSSSTSEAENEAQSIIDLEVKRQELENDSSPEAKKAGEALQTYIDAKMKQQAEGSNV